jgi:outer membrane protein assembly factor BamB
MAIGRRTRWAAAAVLGWLVAAARPLPAADPPRLAGETRRTAQRFNEAAALERQQHWSEAVELYLRLIDEAGDDLVPSDADPNHLLPARALVHRRLAARLELLGPYRDRVEPRAKRLLEQGESQRDLRPLEQLIDSFFCSRSAEAALHLLGDLACERGDFDQARYYWHQLEPAASPRERSYPDPRGAVALARAKQILARLLAGEHTRAAAELREFRTNHPAAVGHLAGRDGNLADTLQHLLDAPDLARVPALAGLALAPTTFAGDGSRNGLLAGMLPPFSPQPRYPAIALSDAAPRLEGRVVQPPPIRPQALVYHPVIARGQVFVADARRVTAYDLASGRQSGQLDLARQDPALADAFKTRPSVTPDTHYTLAVDGDRLYARLGAPAPRSGRGEAASVLVGLQWRPEQATPEERLHLRWLLSAPKADAPADALTVFEGTPVVRDGRLYVALTRFDGNRAVTALACYDADDPASGPLWRQDVYETTAEAAGRTRKHLLTLAGPQVVLCSHAGVIVALEAAGGRRAWAVRYPSRGPLTPAGDPSPRDLAPCVFADGRLFAAPADADRVHCLDAATGAPLWASDRLEIAHLLGVVRGRVVCTTGGYTAGLCALDAATGRRIPDWGYWVPGADRFAPFGRGLLCEDRVYWPTRDLGVNELHWDGTPGYAPAAFRGLPGGNLAYGEGCLVVATADRLHVLVGAAQEAAGPGLRIGHEARDAADHIQSGMVAADRGLVPVALDHFRAAERLARADDELRDRTRAGRHALLLWESERLRRAGRPASSS